MQLNWNLCSTILIFASQHKVIKMLVYLIGNIWRSYKITFIAETIISLAAKPTIGIAGAKCNKNRDGKGLLIRRHLSPFNASFFLTAYPFFGEIHTRRTVGRRQEVGWQKILSFRRSIAFQIARSSNSTRD